MSKHTTASISKKGFLYSILHPQQPPPSLKSYTSWWFFPNPFEKSTKVKLDHFPRKSGWKWFLKNLWNHHLGPRNETYQMAIQQKNPKRLDSKFPYQAGYAVRWIISCKVCIKIGRTWKGVTREGSGLGSWCSSSKVPKEQEDTEKSNFPLGQSIYILYIWFSYMFE